MNNRRKISLIFWLHFLVAVASHFFVVMIVGGVFKLLLGVVALGFWEKGLMLGITFYTFMYATNHITNGDGFCFLTDMENFYRKAEGMDKVGPFTPRFYKKCRTMFNRTSIPKRN